MFNSRHNTILKLLGIGTLVIGLLIPLLMIKGVLNERFSRHNEAVADIQSSWGREQNLVGPVLGIPFHYQKKDSNGVESIETATAYFLPKTLKMEGDAKTDTLHRGIYDASVFRAHVKVSGKFAKPDMAGLKIDARAVQWKDAFVTFAVSDLRGTHEALVIDWNSAKKEMLPGSKVPGFATGASALINQVGPIEGDMIFALNFDFNGSQGIFFAPFGMQNEVTLKSNWPAPSFRGPFLPSERSVREDGFDATWKVSYYGRDYPQQWTSRDRDVLSDIAMFGTEFLSEVDAYRHVERATKYGILFLVLVFTTFFLFEITSRRRIHPLQYLMAGAALCMFYLLLLSLSEFMEFKWAYLAAALASTALIAWYSGSFLGTTKRAAAMGAGMAGVYLFLFVTLQQGDYALLLGAAGLFLGLTIVMYVTRKIDWYARDGVSSEG